MKKLHLLILILAFLFLNCRSFGQGIAINSDNSTPDPSAMLDVKSSSSGLLGSTNDASTTNSHNNPG